MKHPFIDTQQNNYLDVPFDRLKNGKKQTHENSLFKTDNFLTCYYLDF